MKPFSHFLYSAGSGYEHPDPDYNIERFPFDHGALATSSPTPISTEDHFVSTSQTYFPLQL
jgi:hypothetical protein